MKTFSILEPATKEAIRCFAEKRNLTEHVAESYQHPQEDYLIAAKTLPIFVVADGVTLNVAKLVERKEKYPNPSPAGEVAKIFCEAVVKSVSEKYSKFSKENTFEVFRKANSEVAQYNEKIGKSDIAGNPTGFYSATGSFAVIRENKACWASICDSFVAHFDKDMNVKFVSTGVCAPYAVINGEERMADHLESGVFDLERGDFVFVFTDGFEQYVKNRDFQKLFLKWDDDLRGRVAQFSAKMNSGDPESYGHERSLIAVLFDSINI